MNNAKKEIVEQIRGVTNILVTVGKNPTIDELTAALGLTLFLNKTEKYATAVVSSKLPQSIAFLKPQEAFETTVDSLRDFIVSLNKEKADHLRYVVEGDEVKIYITPYRTTITSKDLTFEKGDYNVELVIAIGAANQKQLDDAIASHSRILQDAHVVSISAGKAASELGSARWNNPQASGASEMVADLIDSLKGNKQLDEHIANALLTGIIDQTERFSNPRTNARTMTIAANLMGSGANQQLVVSKLEEDKQRQRDEEAKARLEAERARLREELKREQQREAKARAADRAAAEKRRGGEIKLNDGTKPAARKKSKGDISTPADTTDKGGEGGNINLKPGAAKGSNAPVAAGELVISHLPKTPSVGEVPERKPAGPRAAINDVVAPAAQQPEPAEPKSVAATPTETDPFDFDIPPLPTEMPTDAPVPSVSRTSSHEIEDLTAEVEAREMANADKKAHRFSGLFSKDAAEEATPDVPPLSDALEHALPSPSFSSDLGDFMETPMPPSAEVPADANPFDELQKRRRTGKIINHEGATTTSSEPRFTAPINSSGTKDGPESVDGLAENKDRGLDGVPRKSSPQLTVPDSKDIFAEAKQQQDAAPGVDPFAGSTMPFDLGAVPTTSQPPLPPLPDFSTLPPLPDMPNFPEGQGGLPQGFMPPAPTEVGGTDTKKPQKPTPGQFRIPE